jgi:predicted neutral ceramidase superfamily lipid hydrolase
MVQRGLQRLIVGSALVIASTVILPIARETLRPIMRDLSKQMKYLLVSTKEGIEDIVAEVKFERMKKQLDKEMVIDCDVIIEEPERERIFS